MDTTTNADSGTASPTGLRGRVYAVLEAPDLLRQGGAGDGPHLRGSVIPEIFLVSRNPGQHPVVDPLDSTQSEKYLFHLVSPGGVFHRGSVFSGIRAALLGGS